MKYLRMIGIDEKRLDAMPQDEIDGWRTPPLDELYRYWRMTFAFDGEDAILVDYRDYR